MPKPAIGLPDPEQYGDHTKLPVGKLIDYIVQKHLADRAGLHTDLRFGTPEHGLLSWAVRKGMPVPGQKHLAVRQPLHDHSYKDFEGKIESGYGKGTVTKEDSGEIVINRSAPNAVHFTVAHKGSPERFALIHTGQGRDGKGWLLINSTPTSMLPEGKKRYVPVSPDRAEEIISNLPEGASVQPKIDGASLIMPILKDKIEAISFRQSKKTGGPIYYTEKLFSGIPSPYAHNMPQSLRGSLLRGELYGVDKDNKPITAQQLGGLLNSSISRSLKEQENKNIQLKALLFDIDRKGKESTSSLPYLERYKLLKEITKYLPKEKVALPEQATTAESAMQLWNKIKNKQHAMTEEGVIIHPSTGNPMKAKLRNEHDVWLRAIFPGEGKYKGIGAGGFEYSHEKDGPIVGRVGTGLSDELRKSMFNDPQSYVGRVAKVYAHAKMPSGALREPSLHSLHEDYPHAPIYLSKDENNVKSADSNNTRQGFETRGRKRLSVPVLVRQANDSAGTESKIGSHEILRLSESDSNEIDKQKTRPLSINHLSTLEKHASTLLKQKESEISRLWRKRNYNIEGLEQLRNILSRNGRVSEGYDFGKEGCERQLRKEQLYLGNTKTTKSQYEKKCSFDYERYFDVYGCLGGKARHYNSNNSQETETRLVSRENTTDSCSTKIGTTAEIVYPDIHSRFAPDYTPQQLKEMGVYDSLYDNKGPRLASLSEWKPEWVHPQDPKGWLQWYERYSDGRRTEDDERQIKRWLNFKSRHGGSLQKNPTPRRAFAMTNWGIDPTKVVNPDQAEALGKLMEEYKARLYQKQEKGKVVNQAPRVLEKQAATYYHGSPVSDIKELREGSYVSPDLKIAKLMGRYYTATNKTWDDSDLAEPYYFGKPANFKPGREPDGEPHLYSVKAKDSDLDKLNNPYEHILKRVLKAELMKKQAFLGFGYKEPARPDPYSNIDNKLKELLSNRTKLGPNYSPALETDDVNTLSSTMLDTFKKDLYDPAIDQFDPLYPEARYNPDAILKTVSNRNRWNRQPDTERRELIKAFLHNSVKFDDHDIETTPEQLNINNTGRLNEFVKLMLAAEADRTRNVKRAGESLPKGFKLSKTQETNLDRYDIHNDEKKNVGSLTIDSNKNPLFLHSLQVLPEYRGQGLGRQLVEHALSKYKGQPLELLARPSYDKATSLDQLVKFYESLGLKQKGPHKGGVMMRKEAKDKQIVYPDIQTRPSK